MPGSRCTALNKPEILMLDKRLRKSKVCDMDIIVENQYIFRLEISMTKLAFFVHMFDGGRK
jgi:hypothetical protein